VQIQAQTESGRGSFQSTTLGAVEGRSAARAGESRSWIQRALPWFSKFHVGVVLVLIFLGGHVKSHEAGLAVPDWPTSYGYNMFTFPYEFWVGGIWHEHVHRLVASVLGALTVILALGVWRARPKFSTLGWIMVAAVIIQGLLGGLTVLMRLPAWTSSAHGMLAQAFLCMSVAMAFLLHRAAFGLKVQSGEGTLTPAQTGRVKVAAIVLLGALFIQLGFGAFVRHTEAGLAVLDFPTVAGSWLPSLSTATLETLNVARAAIKLPPVESTQVLLHLLHRYWALVVCFGVWRLWRACRGTRTKLFTGISAGLAWLTLLQVSLGISIVLTHRVILPTSLHVVLGATMMAIAMLVYMRASRHPSS
jgi:cytochrome c oxidase assembly protein subunit 15